MRQLLREDRALHYFFLTTFALAWLVPGALLLLSSLTGAFRLDYTLYSPVYYLAVWSPAIAAVAVTAAFGGSGALPGFAARALRWRCSPTLYAAALILIPSVYLAAAALWSTLGFDAFGAPAELSSYLAGAVLVATAGPLEEIGWRGFALPRLQRRFSGLSAALLLGCIWALWHLPLFVVGGFQPVEFLTFALQILSLSVILSVFFNASGGCVVLAMLIHWLTNFPYP